MGFHWRSIFLFLVISLATLLLSHAHNEPQDYVEAHSCLRALMDSPQLTWDPALAKAAEAWANQRKDCKMIHSGVCGENMAAGPNLNASYAVQLWLDERPDYNHHENKCADGAKCSHYLQAIWKKTERIGCARVKCDTGDCYLIVCNYDPPGNVPGENPC